MKRAEIIHYFKNEMDELGLAKESKVAKIAKEEGLEGIYQSWDRAMENNAHLFSQFLGDF